MSEDQGTNDAGAGAVPGSVAAEPAPATPAALTDKDLDMVAGGVAPIQATTNLLTWKTPGVSTNTFR